MAIKQTLIESATNMFMKYGFKSVSMDDIARLLGISKKTIYDHVENKKDLVGKVVDCMIKDERNAVNTIVKNSDNALQEMTTIAAYVSESLKKMKPKLTFDLKKYHPAIWKKIELQHFKFVEETIKKNLARGIKEGYYREEINPTIVSQLYLNTAKLIIDQDMVESNRIPLSEIYQEFIVYHLNGIVNSKGKKDLKKYLK